MLRMTTDQATSHKYEKSIMKASHHVLHIFEKEGEVKALLGVKGAQAYYFGDV